MRRLLESLGRCSLPTAVFFLTVLLAPFCAGQAVDTDPAAGVEIEVIPHLEYVPPSGWVPLAVRVINRGTEARTWRLTVDRDAGTGRHLLGEWALPVRAGESREFNVFAPQPNFATSSSYSQIRAVISGFGVNSGSTVLNHKFGGGNSLQFTGMSQTLAVENWSRLESEMDPGASSGGYSATQLVGAWIDPSRAPADWRTWSGFATIWLHRDDWTGLATVQRLALLRWVAQGGGLFVAALAGNEVPELPPLYSANPTGGTGFTSGTYGLGLITTLPLESDPSSGSLPRLPIADVAMVIRSSLADSPALAAISNQISPTGAEGAHGTIGPGGPLLGGLIALIAILLGPINLYVLAPAQRRARLFLTVPLISLGGALALVGLILFQDGTGGHGARGVLVALLPDRPEALVLQEQTVRTGLLLNREFAMPEDVTLIDYTDGNVGNPHRYNNHRQPRPDLNRAGPEARGEWFTSRTVHAHHLRTFVSTRATLSLETTGDGTHRVLSTCPGVLRDVVVMDEHNRAWWAEEVPPGRSVALTPASALVTDRGRESLLHFGVSLGAAAAAVPTPWSFRASADAWDETVPVPTLPSIQWGKDTIIVTGFVQRTGS